MLQTSSLFLTFSHEVNQVTARGPARDCFINFLMIHVVETCRLEIIQYYHEASNELNIGSRILEFDSQCCLCFVRRFEYKLHLGNEINPENVDPEQRAALSEESPSAKDGVEGGREGFEGAADQPVEHTTKL